VQSPPSMLKLHDFCNRASRRTPTRQEPGIPLRPVSRGAAVLRRCYSIGSAERLTWKDGAGPRDRRVRNRHLGVCGMRRKVETEVKPVLGGWRVRPRPDRLLKATRELSVGARKEVSYRSIRLDYENQAQGGEFLPLRQRRAAAQASLERGRKRGAHLPQIPLLILRIRCVLATLAPCSVEGSFDPDGTGNGSEDQQCQCRSTNVHVASMA